MKTCDYCLNPVPLLRLSDAGYPYRVDYGPTWTCVGCGAWVGCHRGTENALGRLANAELRAAKQAAHAAFDPLWQGKMRRDKCSKTKARHAGYRWLAAQMGIAYKNTHIGEFDLAQCAQVVEICNNFKNKEPA